MRGLGKALQASPPGCWHAAGKAFSISLRKYFWRPFDPIVLFSGGKVRHANRTEVDPVLPDCPKAVRRILPMMQMKPDAETLNLDLAPLRWPRERGNAMAGGFPRQPLSFHPAP